MQDYELDAYLGDWADTITDEQRERLLREARRLDVTHPDEAAFSAAVAYVLGDITPEQAGRELLRARGAADAAMVAARQVALMAIEDGASEAGTARALGVDRMAVRDWLGKR